MQTIQKELRVFNMSMKEVCKNYPSIANRGCTFTEIIKAIGCNITNPDPYIRNEAPAVIHGKGAYFEGTYKEYSGLFLIYVAVGMEHNSIVLVYNPVVD